MSDDDEDQLIQHDDDDTVDSAECDDDDDVDDGDGITCKSRICDLDCQISVQTCAGVLEYLAMGVATSSIPHYDHVVDEEDRVEEDIDRQERLLTTALAILVDSTSPGPDPLSLSALGWAYGLGAGGGMGDWGACNYVPGDIGAELRELENTVSSKVHIDYGQEVSNYTMDFPATRFCTVGGLPPRKKPYAPGALWQPPLAGICVPSSCTSRDLLTLFGDGDFRNHLLRHSATIERSFDSTTALDVGNVTNATTIESIHIPPAASRRYKYVSYLALSISTGIKFRMGIQCAGETGLPELDASFMSGSAFRGYDYWCTVALVIFLVCCVLVGTFASVWYPKPRDDQNNGVRGGDGGQENMLSNEAGETTGLALESDHQSSSLVVGYGAAMEKGSIFSATQGVAIPQSAQAHQKKSGCCSSIGTWCPFTGTAVVSSLQWSLQKISMIFAPFDAAQSFYEITRMSRDSPYNDILHQKTIRSSGGAALDRAYSSVGLFPTYPLADDDEDRETVVTSESISSSQCLNGMRSISMIWIILGHTIVVQSSVGYQNPSAVLPPTGMIASTPAMFFFSARYAVDTFFFIGGYLVMSGMLKKLDPALSFGKATDSKKRSRVELWMCKLKLTSPSHRVLGTYAHRLQTNKRSLKMPVGVSKWFFAFVLHRILRILPTYGFVLLVWWKLAVTWGNGPFWPRWATFVAQCDKYAWTNMLFINNLVPSRQKFGETSECMYHAWYLGVDFQLCAVMTPIFVTLYLRRGCRRLSFILELLLVALVATMTYVNTFRYDWSGHLMDGKQTLEYDRDAYISPFYRATPYIMGFITAQIWHEKSRFCPNLGIQRGVSIALSIVSAVLMVFLTFFGSSAYHNLPCQIWQDMATSACGSGWPIRDLALYNSFVRPLWSFGLSTMCLLGFNGQLHPLCGGSILTWVGWDPIAKLSFGMYLLHPLVINVWFLSRTSKFSYSHVDFIFLCSGIVTVTFLSALVVGILVEWPLSKITKSFEGWLWNGGKTQNASMKRSQVTDDNNHEAELVVGERQQLLERTS